MEEHSRIEKMITPQQLRMDDLQNMSRREMFIISNQSSKIMLH